MTALPFTADSMTSPRGDVSDIFTDASFEERVESHVRHFMRLWHETPSSLPESAGRITPGRSLVAAWSRFRNARHTRRLVVEIARAVEAYPSTHEEREGWRAALQERIREFGERRFAWPRGYRELFVADDFWHTTIDFVGHAHDFAPEVSSEDLFQALRNVWIINSVQMLFDLPVRCTRPAFAYSMLYPWTDNLLDSPRLPNDAKRAFNRRLGARLRGEQVLPSTRHEQEVFDLVAMIEAEIPRPDAPDVFASLLAIHQGQIASLSQQTPGRSIDDLLSVSVRKGGSSVLPDGYLVRSRLSVEEERFLFGYGVFLQLLDDLQDVSVDLDAGHETLFTAAARQGNLDEVTGRLHNLIDRCLESPGPFAGDAFADRRDLIRRNCVALLVGAVSEEPGRFSRRFRRRLQRDWPLGLGASLRLRRFATRRLRAAVDVVRVANGGASLFHLLRAD